MSPLSLKVNYPVCFQGAPSSEAAGCRAALWTKAGVAEAGKAARSETGGCIGSLMKLVCAGCAACAVWLFTTQCVPHHNR